MSNNPYLSPSASVEDPLEVIDQKQPFLLRCWKGTARLWQAFWIVFVGGYVSLGVLTFTVVSSVPASESRGAIAATILVAALFALALLIFSTVSIWRCAKNTDLQIAKFGAKAVVILVFVLLVFPVVFGGVRKGNEIIEKAKQKQAMSSPVNKTTDGTPR
jgi:hypothetical protein